MKIRADFVTNSSSSSYIIRRESIGDGATLKDAQNLIEKLIKTHNPKQGSVKMYDFNSPDLFDELGIGRCLEIANWYAPEGCLLDWDTDWNNINWRDEFDYYLEKCYIDGNEFDWDDDGTPHFNYAYVCKKCTQHEICGLKKYLGDNGYSLQNALLYLGDFCIFENYEVYALATFEQLHDMCSYYCSHMG